MRRGFAIAWLVIVLAAGGYLGMRMMQGLHFRTEFTALLPRESRNPALEKASSAAIKALSQQVVILVGDTDRSKAIAASRAIAEQLAHSGMAEIITDTFHGDRLQALGEFYFPYRQGLLTEADRQLLQQDHGQAIATRAGSQIYGVMGMANGTLLRNDPFLLMPAFFAGLPTPMSRLALGDGVLSLNEVGTTWVLVAAKLDGDPYATEVQQRFTDRYRHAVQEQRAQHSGLRVLHLGAVFFAQAGAQQATAEISSISSISMLGTVALILLVFCRLSPLALSLLVIAVGMVSALSASLLIFHEMHISALLFGSSLIGVAVDYSLEYFCQIFATPDLPARQRLKSVVMGISLGTATTVIGYITFMLAPLPGLHQIAVFSAVGLAASWLTVVLWLPELDRSRPPRHREATLALAARCLSFWESPAHRRMRFTILLLIGLLAVAGLVPFHTEDDIRRMQSPPPELLAEQEQIRQLLGSTHDNQFFVVQAADDEDALQKEEALAVNLRPLVAEGALHDYQSPAQYVPSARRQRENRHLVKEKLYDPLLAAHLRLLQLDHAAPPDDAEIPVLTLAEATAPPSPFSFLDSLQLKEGGTSHFVLLDGVTDPAKVAHAAEGIGGVHFVDPAGDFSSLLQKYRQRMLILIGAAALLIVPLLFWRYGLRRFLWVILPPLLALVATPALRGLAGGAFTFFDAMALVLVLSIGVDYAVFYAEASHKHKTVTLLSVSLSAITTLLSFGLLALSGTLAVQHFGSTMLVGIFLAYLLAPMARRGCKNH